MQNTTLTLLSVPQIEDFYESGVWRKDTIYSLARSHAEATPDAPAIRDRLRTLTYRELLAAADHSGTPVGWNAPSVKERRPPLPRLTCSAYRKA